jgi:hypothetical protein
VERPNPDGNSEDSSASNGHRKIHRVRLSRKSNWTITEKGKEGYEYDKQTEKEQDVPRAESWKK